jgi:diacylglycerol kinase family enzyme
MPEPGARHARHGLIAPRRSAMEFRSALVVAGGDGTLFHLLCRLSPPWPPVRLVPQGRGNALARDIGTGNAARVDVLRVVAEHDNGCLREYYSVSSVGLGYPSEVTRRSLPLRFLRRLSYAAAAVLTRPRWHRFTISLDGGPPRTARLRGVLVNNTRYTGGFEALPEASSSDGVAECLELTSGYVRQMAHNLSVISGLHCYAPVRITRIRRGWIVFGEPLGLMIDGELLGPVRRVELTVVPGALEVEIVQLARR